MEIRDVIQVYQNTLGLIALILCIYIRFTLCKQKQMFFSFLYDPPSFVSANITKSLYQMIVG